MSRLQPQFRPVNGIKAMLNDIHHHFQEYLLFLMLLKCLNMLMSTLYVWSLTVMVKTALMWVMG
jgi:hypothetical protein